MNNMNLRSLLTFAASLSLAAFILSLATKIDSIPALVVTTVAWVALLMVDSYSFQGRQPRQSRVQALVRGADRKAALPLAA
jgi:hypothetical protein